MYPRSMFWAKIRLRKDHNLSSKNYNFYSREESHFSILHRRVIVMFRFGTTCLSRTNFILRGRRINKLFYYTIYK